MTRATLFAIWAGTALLVVLVIGIAFFMGRTPVGPIQVSVAYMGFTNNAARARLAAFWVSNASPFTIVEGGGVVVSSKSADGQAGSKTWFAPGNPTLLASHASKTLLVPVPTNQSPWRIVLFCVRKESNTRRVVRETSDDLRLPRTLWPYKDVVIWSQWIESNSPPAQHGAMP